MWVPVCETLPVLCALASNFWYGDPMPTRSIDLVKVTVLEQHIPLVIPLPTVTVTETVGVIATPVTDVISAAATISGHARPHPTLESFDYPEPLGPFVASPWSSLSSFSSAGDWFVHKQYSPLDFAILIGIMLVVFCAPFSLVWLPYCQATYARRALLVKVPATWLEKVYTVAVFLPVLAQVLPGALCNYRVIECKDSVEALGMLAIRVIRWSPYRSTRILKALFDVEDFVESIHLLIVGVIPKLCRSAWNNLKEGFKRLCIGIGLSFGLLSYYFGPLKYRLKYEKEDVMQRPQLAYSEITWQDLRTACEMNLASNVTLIARNRDFDAYIVRLQTMLHEARREAEKVVELAKKCQALRQSLIELLRDYNWLRQALGNVMNYRHNVMNGRHPNGHDSQHPFRPCQYTFKLEPDAVTGLHYAIHEGTFLYMSFKSEFMRKTKRFFYDSREAQLVMPKFIDEKSIGPLTPKIDPLEDGGWVLQAMFPDLKLPPYKGQENPFNPSKKVPKPIMKIEGRYVKQIEDFAAAGRLAQWKKPGSEQRVVRFGPSSNRRNTLFPTAPRLQQNYPEPCPDGSPMDTSPIRY